MAKSGKTALRLGMRFFFVGLIIIAAMGCGDSDDRPDLRISPESLVLSPDETGTIDVGGGRYPYESAVSSKEAVATASLNGHTVTVRAVAQGTTEIEIHDGDEYSGTVDVTVTADGQAQNPDDVNSGDGDVNPGDSDEVVVADNVRVLEASAMEHLTYSSESKDELVFGSQAEQVSDLKPNDIIVSGEGEGLLRRVLSVENSDDQIVVRTSEASLTDVFEKCNVSLRQPLSPNDIESSGQDSERDRPRAISEEFLESISIEQDGGVSLTGSLSFRPELDIQIVIQDFRMEYFKAAVSMTETAALRLRAAYEMSVDIEEELATFRLRPIVLWAGGVPIVITPVIRIVGGIQGHVNMEVETNVTQTATLTTGAEYRNQQWNDISGFSNDFSFSPPAPTAEADVKGYAGAILDFLLYGVAGPYVRGELYIQPEISLLKIPCWALYGGINAGAGVKVEILGDEMVNYGKSDMIGFKKELVRAGTDDGTLITSPEDNASFDTGESIAFSARNDDACGLEDLLWTSDIDGEIGRGSSFSKNDLSPGTHIVTLTATHYLDKNVKREKQVRMTVGESEVSACFTAEPVSGEPPLTVNLNAECSEPADEIVSYLWSSSDGKSASGETASMTFDSEGNHIVSLTVADGNENSDSEEKTVNVRESGEPSVELTCNGGKSCNIPCEGTAELVMSHFNIKSTGQFGISGPDYIGLKGAFGFVNQNGNTESGVRNFAIYHKGSRIWRRCN